MTEAAKEIFAKLVEELGFVDESAVAGMGNWGRC